MRILSGVSLASVAILLGCASPQTLSGGEKDMTPPAIIEEESTSNKQINFSEKEIILTFDEWVTLKDVNNQLVISPLMPKPPVVKMKGKSIILTLPDSLREETTYSIQFGDAIADLNEGNIWNNQTFVFSTGSFLDSIEMSGSVLDVITQKPIAGVWVMFHEADIDSAVYKTKPAYVAKTNDKGEWKIGNMRSDSFHVTALKDGNANFLYDQEGEIFGWHEEVVVTDTSHKLSPIVVFPREKKTFIESVSHPYPGWIKLHIPGPAPKPVLYFEPLLPENQQQWVQDTLHIWYVSDASYQGHVILEKDTTQIRPSSGSSLKNGRLQMITQTGRIHPAEKAVFLSQIPLSDADTSRLTVANDSLGPLPFVFQIDSLNPRQASVAASWKSPFRYSMVAEPGALKDFFGRTNDTLKLHFIVTDAEQFGVMIINVTGLDTLRQYVLQIMTGDKVVESFSIQQTATSMFRSKPMLPGKFILELIDDRNGNGRWDTGDYDKKRAPEPKQIFEPDNLRAGWELDVTVQWRQ